MAVSGTTSSAPATTSSSSDSSAVRRKNFDYKLTLKEGKGKSIDLGKEGWTLHLRAIRLLERVDGVSELRIRFYDPQSDPISNAKKVKNGSTISVELGWRETDTVNHGQYNVISWEQVDGKLRTFEIVALNDGLKLAREGEVQKVWEKKQSDGIKDSEIVTMIAKKHKLIPMVEDSEVKYPHVIQASESDYDFIMRRAKLYGYQCYVLGNALYFRPIEFTKSKHVLNLRVDPENFADNVSVVRMRTDPFLKAQLTRKAQVHGVTFEILDETGKYEKDNIAEESEGSIIPSVALATWPDAKTRPVKNLIHQGHLQDVTEMKRQLDEAIKSSGFAIVQVDCETRGLESSFAGNSITLNFDDDFRYSGVYYIRRVEHVWDSFGDGTYQTRFNLVRSFEHMTRGEPKFGGGSSAGSGGGGTTSTGVTGIVG